MGTKDKTAEPTLEAEGEALPIRAPMAPALETKTIEEWQAIRQPDAWAHEAAKSLKGWPLEQRVTGAEYDDAIKGAQQIEVS